jgi:hypothetical protein
MGLDAMEAQHAKWAIKVSAETQAMLTAAKSK